MAASGGGTVASNRRIRGITIEIDGDTVKLTDALKQVNTELSKTSGALKDVENLLKVDPGNVDLLRQKQDLLTRAIDDTKKKLEQEKDALKQLEGGEQTEKTREQQEKLTREIADTENALKSLKDEYKDFGSVAGQQIAAVGGKMQEVGGKISDAGKALAPVSAVAAAGLTAAVKTYADFDAQMSKVKAISGATAEEMEALSDKAVEMGGKTKFSASEAGAAFEYMAMAGWKTEDMLGGIEGIMNLAAASGEELATTSDIVTDALTAFKLSAKDSGHFADVLAAASSNANTNVSMLGESFKYAAPVAGAMGYSIEDTSLALGLMANSGIKASTAGTGLRAILTNMANPTENMAIAMKNLGLTLEDGQGNMLTLREVMEQMRTGFGDLRIPAEEFNAQMAELDSLLAEGRMTEEGYAEAQEELIHMAYGAEGAMQAQNAAMLAGKQNMSALLAIVNASPADWEKLTSAVDTASNEVKGFNGLAEYMAHIMQDNLEGDTVSLGSKIETLAISIGQILEPVVRQIIEKMQSAVDWLNSLDDDTKKMIVTVGVTVAALGPLLLGLGNVISSVGTILTLAPMLLSPIGLIVAAVAGLIAILTTLYIKNKDFRDAVNKYWEDIGKTIKGIVDGVIKHFQGWVDFLGGIFSGDLDRAVKGIKNIVLGPLEAISAFVDGLHKAAQNTINVLKSLIGMKDKADGGGGGTFATGEQPKKFAAAYHTPYILQSPTIFGASGGRLLQGGDGNGAEVVAGFDLLRNMMLSATQEALAAAGGGGAAPAVINLTVDVGGQFFDRRVIQATQNYNYRSGGR